MAELYSVRIFAKCNITEKIADFARKNENYINIALCRSANLKIAECAIQGDCVHFHIRVIGGTYIGAYVPKKPERVIAEFVRRYKYAVLHDAQTPDFWHTKTEIQKL